MPKKQSIKREQSPATNNATAIPSSNRSWMTKLYLPYLTIFALCFVVYGNSILNGYASDDGMVVVDNKFTLRGFGGIKDLLTHDAFVGAVGVDGEQLVSGGRYRPLSFVSLAIEVQLFGLNPAVSHFINVLLFALTCVLLYYLLSSLLHKPRDAPFYYKIAFVASVLFAAHPIHTEVVANIKGRDEIMSLLFALLATYAGLAYVQSQHIKYLAMGAVAYFMAIMSKENAITFLLIIPLTYYFFTKADAKNYLVTVALYVIPVALFLYLRATYTHSGLATESFEIFNNPFAYLPHTMEGICQRYATIIMTFLLYIKILIYPHPLTHDYYFNQIPIIGMTDPVFILSLIINGSLLVYAIKNISGKSVVAYAILFYFVSFSIVSNLPFTIGVLMNERFVFTSSVGFVMLLATFFASTRDKYHLSNTMSSTLLFAILFLYSVKTISRNPAWRDNMTLFQTDAKTSTNSAKAQMTLAGNIIKFAETNFDSLRVLGKLNPTLEMLDMDENASALPNDKLQIKLLEIAASRLKKSIEIYPDHALSLLTLGTVLYKVDHNNATEALSYYYKAIEKHKDPYFDALFEIGRIQLDEYHSPNAKETFIKALSIKPNDYACSFNLAKAYTSLNMNDSAIYWHQKVIASNPTFVLSYYNLGLLYGRQLHELDSSIKYMSKAIEYDPNVAEYYDNIGTAYGMKGKTEEVIKISLACLKKFPAYIPALKNLVVSYSLQNNIKMAAQYEAQIAQISKR
jgi:protein O-mannosyl-transferase